MTLWITLFVLLFILIDYNEHPDAYLKEIGEVFGCSDVAVLYAFKRLGITRKKRLNATKNKTL